MPARTRTAQPVFDQESGPVEEGPAPKRSMRRQRRKKPAGIESSFRVLSTMNSVGAERILHLRDGAKTRGRRSPAGRGAQARSDPSRVVKSLSAGSYAT